VLALGKRESIEGNIRQRFDRNYAWFLSGLFVLYAVLTTASAALKPLWNDELFTLYVSRLSSPIEIWRALVDGGDIHPPLDYWLRHLSMRMLGGSELAFRAPSIAGFWLGSIAVFWFVARRTSPLYGLIGMLAPLTTVAYEYAFEARAYAFLLAAAGGALVSWQYAAEGRRIALLPLALCLAAAVYLHYFGILLCVPLAAGELFRTYTSRRVDYPVWAALAGGGVGALTLWPLIAHVREHAGELENARGVAQLLAAYPNTFHLLLIPLSAFLPFLCWLSSRQSQHDERAPGLHGTFPRHELVASAAMFALPALGYVFSITVTGTFTFRYVLPVVLGAGILLALAAHSHFRKMPAAPVALACCMLGSFFLYAAALVPKQARMRAALHGQRLEDILDGASIPIVVGNHGQFLLFSHYTAPGVRERLVYLADPAASLRATGFDSPDLGLKALSRWTKLNVVSYRDFIQTNSHFWLIMSNHPNVWQLGQLVRDGHQLHAKGLFQGETVYEVTRPLTELSRR
jgi:hypothetical protein